MIIPDCFASIVIFEVILLVSIALGSGYGGCLSSTCLFWTRLLAPNIAVLTNPSRILVNRISYWSY